MRDDTAAALLEGAARRFVSVGVSKTTMAEIAAEAGVTKPTLYKRYADKAAVVDALVRRETETFRARLDAAAATAPDAATALETTFVTAVRWLDRHPFLRRALASEPQLMLPLLTEPRGPVLAAGLDAFGAIVRRGVEAGELRAVEPARVAEVWWRLVLSYVLLPAVGSRPRGPAALRELAREALVDGIRKEAR